MRALRCQAAVLALLAVGAACAEAEEAPLRIALTKKLFWHDGPEDVIPQAQLIGDQVGERINREIVVEARGEDVGEVYEALNKGEVDLVISDGLDYARLKTGRLARGARAAPLPVRPVVAVGLVTDSKELALAGCTRSLVVVRSEQDLRDFSDLAGKRLVYSPESENDCAKLFLKSLTRGADAPESGRFFSKISRLGSSDACVISLQFGGADVTCIPELMYLARQMVAGEEMRGLDVLARSPHYTAYVCFYLEGRLNDGLVKRLRDELLKVHERPRGKKLLQQLQIEKFVPFEDEMIEPIIRLIEEAEGGSPAERRNPSPGAEAHSGT